MFKTFTVALFGHRCLDNSIAVFDKLKPVIKSLLKEKEYVEFLIGNNGDFDILAASCIKRAIKELSYGNSALVLVLARPKKNIEDLEKYYHEVEFCDEALSAHYKNAITVRNCKMIDRADLVIAYQNNATGGAFRAVKYAKSQNKEIINLAVDTTAQHNI